MSDFILRPVREEDREQIIRIWQASFGDSEEFIRDILSCGLMESAVGAEADGLLRCCMFSFDGIYADGIRSSYLYALCTQPEYRGRGMGRDVAFYAAETALARGAQAAFLRPADASLETWYADSIGAIPFARESRIPVSSCGASAMPREIGPEEYQIRRQAFSPRWRLPPELIHAQDCINRHFGGAFLDLGEGIVCAEKNSCGAFIREALGCSLSDAAGAAVPRGEEAFAVVSGGDGRCLMLLPVGNFSLFPCCLPPLPVALD